jgi:peptide/nickel transport system substrate-binding protein
MITIAIPPPISLDAQISENGTLLDNFYQNLVYWDPADESKLAPVLAASLPERVDPLTWHVKLRHGVTFANGEAFDAEAAAFSINDYLDPATNAGNISELAGIIGATVVSPDTVEIKTEKPDPILPARLTRVYMVPPKYSSTADFATKPVGTGPYRFVEYVPGQYMTIERNDKYWGEKPAIKQARFNFMTDNQAMVAALSTGQVQLGYNVLASSKDAVPQYMVHDGLNNAYLRMKTYEGPLQDENLRKAIAYVADSKSYAKSIYSGTAEQLNCQTLGPTVTGYNPALKPYPYDPEEAKKLVAASHYDGSPITISAPTDWLPLVSPVIESLSNAMNSVGINTKVELTPRDVWSKAILTKIGQGQPDIVFSASSTELHDADKLSVLIGAKGLLSSDPSPELTEKLDAARVELDPTVRQSIYDEITTRICDQARLVSLYSLQNTWGAASNLHWTPRADGNARVADMSFSGGAAGEQSNS